MIKIILVEDHNLIRSSIESMLNQIEDFNVVATASCAADIPSLCEKYDPDLVISDICTEKDANGILFCAEAKKKCPKIKTIVMTGVLDSEFIDLAKNHSINSFLYKNVSVDYFVQTIISVMNGYNSYPSKENFMESNKKVLSALAPKEMAILTLLCNGFSRNEVADKLGLAKGTVKNYLASILEKTNFDDLSKLIIYCLTNKLIKPDLNEIENICKKNHRNNSLTF